MGLVTKTFWQVERGDDWKSIAAQLGVSKTQLLSANGLKTSRPLVVGELLEVPFV